MFKFYHVVKPANSAASGPASIGAGAAMAAAVPPDLPGRAETMLPPVLHYILLRPRSGLRQENLDKVGWRRASPPGTQPAERAAAFSLRTFSCSSE